MGSACACCRSDIESEIVRLRLLRSYQQERLATQLIAHDNSEGMTAIRAINCAIYQLQHPDEPAPDELLIELYRPVDSIFEMLWIEQMQVHLSVRRTVAQQSAVTPTDALRCKLGQLHCGGVSSIWRRRVARWQQGELTRYHGPAADREHQ